jgi:hypothetical protein
MALNFPNSPAVNDTVELAGKTYQWDGVKWRVLYVVTPPPPTASTAAPTITIVTESPTGVTFTLTNNDDNTALITYDIDTTLETVELAAAATSSNITVALAAGTYTLSAFATVVGEVATSATASVTIVIPQYEELFSTTVATATTEINITSLSIGKDDTLRLVYTMIGNESDSNTSVDIQVNGITSNYHRQLLSGSSTSLVAVRETNSRFARGRSASNRPDCGFVDIKISNNDRFVAQVGNVHRIGSVAADIFNEVANIINTDTVTSITSLKLVATANQIGVGTKIQLYKVTEAA